MPHSTFNIPHSTFTVLTLAVLISVAAGARGLAGIGQSPTPPSPSWEWQQTAAFGGAPTWFSAAAATRDKAYLGTGYDDGNAFWQYDAGTDAWRRTADFPGLPRGGALAFAVNDRVYVGTGFHEADRFQDLWEYAPEADRWTRKAPLPGRPRDHAVAFVVGGRAYVAGGMTCDGSACGELDELWEYDPQSDRWAGKAPMPQPLSASAAFVVRGKAYVVTGRTGTIFSTAVMEYDPRADRWTRKAAFPGPSRARAVGFSVNGRGYLATGLQSISPTSAAVLRDLWEYDASRDAWTQRPDLAGAPRGAAVAFVIGSRVFIGTGIDGRRRLLNDFWCWNPGGAPSQTRAEELPAAVGARIDAIVAARIADFRVLNVGVVQRGKVVFTKAYAEGRLDAAYEYASVSKPVTSTIVLQLRKEGAIKSLDDEVGTYVPAYRRAMPEAFKGARITLRQLLMHRSGIPHNEEPPLVGGRFNLKFEPGTRMLYSTPGYGLLGQVVEAVTGLSYDEAVKRYIGDPVGARSFRASASFIAPGAYVFSTIGDMARFAAGVMGGRYVPRDMLEGEAWRPEAGTYGYGWSVAGVDTDDLAVAHTGSNGLPRAHIRLQPRQNAAVVILAEMKSFTPRDLDELCRAVFVAVK